MVCPRFPSEELLKQACNRGEEPNLYFWRDRSGHEVDILIDQGLSLLPVEVKSGQTLTRDQFRGLEQWRRISGDTEGRAVLVHGGEIGLDRNGVEAVPWRKLSKLTW